MDEEQIVMAARELRYAMTAAHASHKLIAFSAGRFIALSDNAAGEAKLVSDRARQVDHAIGRLEAAYTQLADLIRQD